MGTKVGLAADKPVAAGPKGYRYVASDTNQEFVSDGTDWIETTDDESAALGALDTRLDTAESDIDDLELEDASLDARIDDLEVPFAHLKNEAGASLVIGTTQIPFPVVVNATAGTNAGGTPTRLIVPADQGGSYKVDAVAMLDTVIATTIESTLRLNGVTNIAKRRKVASATDEWNFDASLSAVVELAAGDYIEFEIQHDDATDATDLLGSSAAESGSHILFQKIG